VILFNASKLGSTRSGQPDMHAMHATACCSFMHLDHHIGATRSLSQPALGRQSKNKKRASLSLEEGHIILRRLADASAKINAVPS
jgi:hypothetical protein